MSFEIFLDVVAFFSETKLFKQLGQPGIDSRSRWRPNVVTAVARERCINTISIEGDCLMGRRCSQLFGAAKLKYRGCFGNRLRVSGRKLFTPRLNVRVWSELPFEHLERIDSDV